MHRIRLLGPWQCRAIAVSRLTNEGLRQREDGPLPPPGRVHVPADWTELWPDFFGVAEWERSFGKPSNLQNARVDLVLDRVDGWYSVKLNETQLVAEASPLAALRRDITKLLLPRNTLVVEIDFPVGIHDSGCIDAPERLRQAGGVTGEVRLEIHEH